MINKAFHDLKDIICVSPLGTKGFHDQQQTPPLISEGDDQQLDITFSDEEEFLNDNDSLRMILSQFPPRSFDDDSFSFSSHNEDDESNNEDDDFTFPETLTIEFSTFDDKLMMNCSPFHHDTTSSTPQNSLSTTNTSRNCVPLLKKWRRAKHTRRLHSIPNGR